MCDFKINHVLYILLIKFFLCFFLGLYMLTDKGAETKEKESFLAKSDVQKSDAEPHDGKLL